MEGVFADPFRGQLLGFVLLATPVILYVAGARRARQAVETIPAGVRGSC